MSPSMGMAKQIWQRRRNGRQYHTCTDGASGAALADEN